MKKTTKILVCLVVCVALLASLFSVSVMARESTLSIQVSNLKTLLKSDLKVAANEDAGLETDIQVELPKSGGIGVLYLPGGVDASRLKFTWGDSKTTLIQGSTKYENGTAPIAEAGKGVKYIVKKGLLSSYITVKTYQGSDGVEPLYLTIDESMGTIASMNADTEHETFCYGTAKCGKVNQQMAIKGRGNSTWKMPKKPYNITFYKNNGAYDDKKKIEMIDGVKAKKWSLLANYFDSTLLRNKIAYQLASDMGIGLPTKFVDVFMNGEYLGNYLLTPKKDYNCPDNGYIIENDHIPDADEEQFAIEGMHEMILKHNRINVDDIGKNAEAAGENLETIRAYVNEAWAAVLDFDSEDYQNYFDLDSWAKMFLMFEVSKTYDCYAGNILMHRDGLTENDKLIAGPAWDYDIAFGRTLHKFLVGVSEPVQLNAEGWYNDSLGLSVVNEPVSILQGLGMHASFMRNVVKVYNEYKWAFEALNINVDEQAALIWDSAQMNGAKLTTHPLSGEYVIAKNTIWAMGTGDYRLNYEVTLTYQNFLNNLKQYNEKRVMWLSYHLQPGVDIYTIKGGHVTVD